MTPLFDFTMPAWMFKAACADRPDVDFHPPHHQLRSGARIPAVAVCRTCPVTVQCLQFALDNNDEHGIWGGLTPQQRAALTKENA